MSLRIGIVGAGLIGEKRAGAIPPSDRIIGVHDVDPARAGALASGVGAKACPSLDALLAMAPDVVVVSTTHDALAPTTVRALGAGAHVLVEKPAGLSGADVDVIADAAAHARRLVKVGFNHRFHPGIRKLIAGVRSGVFGPVMFMRARYGHGGRLGYESEWRADPGRSGGGELIDQGMHLVDLSHALIGPLPLHSALVHTDFWDMEVDDNAVLILGASGRHGAWSTFHVSCSEWKNVFEMEVYARTAKWTVSGLAGSYGPQVLRTFRMAPEMGPPDVEELAFPPGDASWTAEWEHFRSVIASGGSQDDVEGGIDDARYAHAVVHDAYVKSGYRDPGGRAVPRSEVQ